MVWNATPSVASNNSIAWLESCILSDSTATITKNSPSFSSLWTMGSFRCGNKSLLLIPSSQAVILCFVRFFYCSPVNFLVSFGSLPDSNNWKYNPDRANDEYGDRYYVHLYAPLLTGVEGTHQAIRKTSPIFAESRTAIFRIFQSLTQDSYYYLYLCLIYIEQLALSVLSLHEVIRGWIYRFGFRLNL